MCLSTIEKKYPKKDKTEGFGWKVFLRGRNGVYKSVILLTEIKKEKWYRRKITHIGDGALLYESGFHIF